MAQHPMAQHRYPVVQSWPSTISSKAPRNIHGVPEALPNISLCPISRDALLFLLVSTYF